MITRLSTRHTIFGVYAIVGACIIAHSVNAFVEHSSTMELMPAAPVPVQTVQESAPHDPKRLAQSILDARLFPVPPDVDSLERNGRRVTPLPPLEVAKKFSLLGTAVNPATGGLVILEEVPSKKQALYHLNDIVQPVGTIIRIEKDRVLFKNNEQEEWLALAIGNLTTGFEPRLSAGGGSIALQPPAPRGVPASSSGRRRIDRQYLIETAGDSARLFYHGQPVPHMVKGRAQGIRLEAVNFYGFYGKLGLKEGDVLKRVNGIDLRDPTRLPSIVQSLKEEHSFKLDILRNETPLTLTYDVG